MRDLYAVYIGSDGNRYYLRLVNSKRGFQDNRSFTPVIQHASLFSCAEANDHIGWIKNHHGSVKIGLISKDEIDVMEIMNS